MKVLLPSWPSSCSIWFFIARIAVMTRMMEKTPTSTPRRVRPERSLWVARALMAIRKFSPSSMKVFLVIAQRVDGTHPCGTPGRQKARDESRHDGDGERQGDDIEGERDAWK